MKIIIQSFGDIITNSSTETFCISNGSVSDLQLLIDTILKVYGINNSSIIVKEIVDYDSLSDLSSGQVETLAEIVYENSGIDSNTFLEYASLGKWNLLENMLSNVGSSLLEMAKIYNDTVQYGLIFTRYTIETTIPNTDALKQQIESYKNAIAVLLGVLPSNLPINLDKYNKNITATTFNYNTKKLYDLPLSIIRSRPDIMASEATIRAQNAVVSEAITNLYPTVSLSATFGFISSSGNSLFNKDSQVYGYTPGLSLPVWHWGQLTNNIELQKHIKEEYILNYNEAMLTAVSEIKNAITATEQAYKTNAYRKNSYYKMRNVMNLTREKYENGLVDFTDVATAEQNLLNAQTALAASNAEILQYITAFYKATGGGYNLEICK